MQNGKSQSPLESQKQEKKRSFVNILTGGVILVAGKGHNKLKREMFLQSFNKIDGHCTAMKRLEKKIKINKS